MRRLLALLTCCIVLETASAQAGEWQLLLFACLFVCLFDRFSIKFIKSISFFSMCSFVYVSLCLFEWDGIIRNSLCSDA